MAKITPRRVIEKFKSINMERGLENNLTWST